VCGGITSIARELSFMHITLISPRMSLRPVDSEFKRIMAPSLALLTVAALTPPEHHISLIDENVSTDCPDGSPDLVGISVNVDTSRRAYDIAQRYRQRGIPVIMGGIHPSANSDEALMYADSVCIGPADGVWQDILHDVVSNSLRRIYRASSEAAAGSIPIPRWDLIDSSKYLYTNIVSTSRGCPFRCDFCYNSSSYVPSKVANRGIEEVLRDIEKLGTRHVMFIDDNFIGTIPWTRKLLRELTPMKLRWNAAVSSNIVSHPDLLDEMAASGCQSLFIGFESLNASSLAGVNKGHNDIPSYDRLIKELHEREIMINASLVFGLDSDRCDVFRTTLDWLVGKRLSTITAHILTPYPGTALFKRFHQEGRITNYDWSHYNTSRVVFRPKHMSAKELEEGYLWIYREFYSMRSIIRRMPPGRRQWMPYLLFNLIYRKFGTIASSIASRTGLMKPLGKLARRLAYGID
jgi:radical SAM superfamily enzyme YgiQ (UPF0313 family)